ncbi:zinc finger and SCAN domain containing protein 4C-like [Arvicanthis niloticus]|uniref:zinc finger and SCAN domain containing protein 4C-like n=1 Tax=Arvicanthis niloticus TaxID=61156 RepID=UPI00148623B2|nr:zinc finger and SCAN domain containing protein 4C-like [Arvicanthis niloticus]
MASRFRGSFKHNTPAKDLQADSLGFIPTQSSSVQWAEDIYNSPSTQPIFSTSNNGCWAKQELQNLWEMFTSWLQPKKQTKKQMISQLVLKQFLLTGHCKDKFALMEKWKASGSNMERFMENVTDECLKPPVMVHVSMQGQEALFSENMSLKEVIELLKQQQSATRPTPENARMPVDITLTTDCLLSKGQESSENECNTSWNVTEVTVGDGCTGNENNSLLIIQKEQYPECEEGCVVSQFPQGGTRASQGNSSHHVEFLSTATTADVPMQAHPMVFCRRNISEDRMDCYNTSRSDTQLNSGDDIPRNKMDSLFIRQRMHPPESEMADVSYGVPQDSKSQGTSTCQPESLEEAFSEENPKEVTGFLSRPEQSASTSEPVLLCQNHEANSPRESHPKRFRRGPKPYKCDKCPRTFKYARSLSSHQRTHLNKKSFVCVTCQKIFKRFSDLRIHEIIHKPEKPFICSTCNKSFSHKTNLKAHERTHTGEKPYACPLCSKCFCQSSTYHRHLRKIHKSD